jgi:lysophospholipase L1-like esterase
MRIRVSVTVGLYLQAEAGNPCIHCFFKGGIKMKKKSLMVMFFCVLSVAFLFVGCDPNGDESKPCVVMLGDSIFALSDQEAAFLEDLSGDTYRKYYVSGAQIVGGLIKTIPRQYEDAIADGPVRTVIMDGGGNDILIGANATCSVDYGDELSDDCYDVMEEVLDESERVFEKMVDDGVKNIIYQGYYYVRNEQLWEVTDVFQEKAIALANELDRRYRDVKIVFVDPRDHFEQGDTSYLAIDGIHPNRAASRALANLVWDAMVDNDIEQGEPCL